MVTKSNKLANINRGAIAKVAQMTKDYETIDLRMGSSSADTPDRVSTLMSVNVSSVTLDVESVIKALQTISSNLELDKLIISMLKIVVEVAGNAILWNEPNFIRCSIWSIVATKKWGFDFSCRASR